jgi:ADP-heptose:LPS heptosyltransferase
MNVLKKINAYRRTLTKSFTNSIGKTNFNQKIDLTKPVLIKRVFISRPNGRLGNLLLIGPLIQEVTDTFPDCTIDLFVKGGLAPIVFKNYDNVNTIISLPGKPFKDLTKYIKCWFSLKKEKYDLAINVDNGSSSGRLSTQFTRSKYKFLGDTNQDLQSKYKDYDHIAKYPIYNLRSYLTLFGIKDQNNPIPSLDLKLSAEEIAQGKKLVDDITKNEKQTICIFTFATGAKCYSESWWSTFYGRLKAEYANYNIIEVLPVENVSQIAFKAPTFYSRDVREIGSFIANTALFIGADSGIMHLASASKTTTVGLFSGTNISKYEPYNNHSVAISTNNGNIDEWIKTINTALLK